MKQCKHIERECKKHGLTTYVLEMSGYYRCKKCRSNNVQTRRHKLKTKLVETFGGKCKICGYDRCKSSLHFHHLDPTQKEFGLASKGRTMAFKTLLKEAEKCILVCSNCHGEIHEGLVSIPL